MKHLFITLLLSCMFGAAMAQDIIITTDAKKIEVRITEVSKSEIKYKEADNIDGPVFVLPIEDISTVIYANGKVSVFSPQTNVQQLAATSSTSSVDQPQQAEPLSPDATKADVINLISGEAISCQITAVSSTTVSYLQNGISFTLPTTSIANIAFANGQVKTYTRLQTYTPQLAATNQPANNSVVVQQTSVKSSSEYTSHPISREGNLYYYGNLTMGEGKYRDFLKNNCTPAYEQFRKGTSVAVAGYSVLIAGTSLGFAGIMYDVTKTQKNLKELNIVLGMLIPALVLDIASIPMLIVGYKKMHSSVDVFNQSCVADSRTPRNYLSLQASSDGLGLAFHF